MAIIEVDGRYTIPGIAEAYEICLQKSVFIGIAGSLYSEVYFKMWYLCRMDTAFIEDNSRATIGDFGRGLFIFQNLPVV